MIAEYVDPRRFGGVLRFANDAHAQSPTGAIEKEGHDGNEKVGEVDEQRMAAERRADNGHVGKDRDAQGSEGRNAVRGEHAFLAQQALEEEGSQAIGQESHRDAGDKNVGSEAQIEDGQESGKHDRTDNPGNDAEREAFRRIGDRDRGEGGHDHETIEGDIENSGLISEETAERGVNQRRRDADGGVGDVRVHHRAP